MKVGSEIPDKACPNITKFPFLGSPDSDRPSSPKYTRNRSRSPSSQSDRGRSSTPENESYSGSDLDVRAKSSSPARSSVSGSQKNTSIQIKNISTRPGGKVLYTF